MKISSTGLSKYTEKNHPNSSSLTQLPKNVKLFHRLTPF